MTDTLNPAPMAAKEPPESSVSESCSPVLDQCGKTVPLEARTQTGRLQNPTSDPGTHAALLPLLFRVPASKTASDCKRNRAGQDRHRRLPSSSQLFQDHEKFPFGCLSSRFHDDRPHQAGALIKAKENKT